MWLLYALSAGLLFTIVGIVDHFTVHKKLKEPMIGLVTGGPVYAVCFALLSLVTHTPLTTNEHLILLGIAMGFVSTASDLFYYNSLRHGEISRVAPLFSTGGIFSIALGAFVLGERFSLPAYVGVIFVILGAIYISWERHPKKASGLSAAFAIGVGLAGAFYGLLVKLVTQDGTNILSVFPWIGMGQCLASLIFALLFRKMIAHEHLHAKFIQAIHLIVLTDVLSFFGVLAIIASFAFGPLTLTSAVLETRPLFIFLGALTLSAFFPKFMHEMFAKPVLIQKLLATTIIIAGCILIAVGM
jgi:drug/metabolite transporter (DMT)-like permease